VTAFLHVHLKQVPEIVQARTPVHEEPLLLDLALVVERARPWPLVAPNSPM